MFSTFKMEIDEKAIFYGILSFMVLEFLWEFYLERRQLRVYKKHTTIPLELIGLLSPETFEKAREYAIDKSHFTLLLDSYSLVLNVLLLAFDGLLIFWVSSEWCLKYVGYQEENEILQSAVFIVLNSLVQTILKLPFSVYNTFVLEEKHGFNKQTAWFYIKDKIKSFIVMQVLFVPFTCGIIYIVKIGGDFFFLYLWLFATVMLLFFLTIYPDFIAPLFDKYTLLPEGELRTEIESLAKSVDFPLYKLYVVEGSKRSAHSNAYFYGFYKNKRIVLFDTLIKGYVSTEQKEKEKEEDKNQDKAKDSNDEKKDEDKGCDTYEVLAVLAHELGHWKLNHLIKNLIISQVNMFVVFVGFRTLFQYKPLYAAFGFNTTPVIIGLIIVLQYVFMPYSEVVQFFIHRLSRKFEFEADRFAKKLGRSNYLKKALVKLNSDNLGFPINDPWYSQWHHSHPPLLERLQALEKED